MLELLPDEAEHAERLGMPTVECELEKTSEYAAGKPLSPVHSKSELVDQEDVDTPSRVVGGDSEVGEHAESGEHAGLIDSADGSLPGTTDNGSLDQPTTHKEAAEAHEIEMPPSSAPARTKVSCSAVVAILWADGGASVGFFLLMFLLGIATSLVEGLVFLFFRNDLGASYTLCGVSVLITVLFEVHATTAVYNYIKALSGVRVRVRGTCYCS